ncbi:hypothetical protein D2962_01525 [Biomaibacter acetigenes]|uniref:ETS domain-containing protein n=2 Tax=Biomaibacter acetigenes TaxID=2316383 RepID=A0A3G2R1Y7_9FIRM|nr:hypothetical protein D2962_01525 [Biomaibacter acetigenes]RKL61730.1 hypothetical protein DXT63_15425 [Thermoanaerobacteraceae bacterium SP2]
MKKTVLLSIILFVSLLVGCGIGFEKEADQEIEKILNESNYENIITYKGESQNWKVNYIDEYTDIWEKDSENKDQYYMKVKRNWILIYKGNNLNELKGKSVNCCFKSPINVHSTSAKFENGIFISQEEKEQKTSIPRGQEDFKYEAIITWDEKNTQKNEIITLHIDKNRLATERE